MRLIAGVLACAALLALGGCAESGVVRVLDGREVEGRFISEEAYGAYAEAEARAARGEVAEALAAFERAARYDPESVEIWTRVGALVCKRSAAGRGSRRVEDAFRRAEELDARYAPLWRERARCYRDGEPDPDERVKTREQRELAALEASARAVELDGDDVEAAALRASLLVRAKRSDEARRLLVALTVRRPSSAEAFLALYELARDTHDEALALRAGERVLALAPRLAARIESELGSLAPLATLDAALREGDLPRARRLAHHAHVPLAELSLRALALGQVAPARALAELLAGADPDDRSAWIALAVAADLAGDRPALDQALHAVPPVAHGGALSPLARLLFAELLDRHLGAEPARLWLGASVDVPAGDPLVGAVSRRVRARLDGGGAHVAAPAP